MTLYNKHQIYAIIPFISLQLFTFTLILNLIVNNIEFTFQKFRLLILEL